MLGGESDLFPPDILSILNNLNEQERYLLMHLLDLGDKKSINEFFKECINIGSMPADFVKLVGFFIPSSTQKVSIYLSYGETHFQVLR